MSSPLPERLGVRRGLYGWQAGYLLDGVWWPLEAPRPSRKRAETDVRRYCRDNGIEAPEPVQEVTG